MAMYIIVSRFSPEAFRELGEFKKIAEAVSARSRASVQEFVGRIATRPWGASM